MLLLLTYKPTTKLPNLAVARLELQVTVVDIRPFATTCHVFHFSCGSAEYMKSFSCMYVCMGKRCFALQSCYNDFHKNPCIFLSFQ